MSWNPEILFIFFAILLSVLLMISDYRCSVFIWQMSQITNLKDYATSHQNSKMRRFRNVFFLAIICIAYVCFTLQIFVFLFIFNTDHDSSVVDDIMLVNTATALLTTQNI